MNNNSFGFICVSTFEKRKVKLNGDEILAICSSDPSSQRQAAQKSKVFPFSSLILIIIITLAYHNVVYYNSDFNV